MQKFALLGLIVTVGCISQTHSAKAGTYEPVADAAPGANSATCDPATAHAEGLPGVFDENNPPPNDGHKETTLIYGRTFNWVPDANEPAPAATISLEFVLRGNLIVKAQGGGAGGGRGIQRPQTQAKAKQTYSFSYGADTPLFGFNDTPKSFEKIAVNSQNFNEPYNDFTRGWTFYNVTPNRFENGQSSIYFGTVTVDISADATADSNAVGGSADATSSGAKATVNINVL